MLLGQAVGVANGMLLTMQVLCLLFALALGWQALQGARGIPDHKGKKTGPATTVVLFVVAVGLLVFAVTLLPILAA